MRVFNPLPVSPISIHALTRRAAASHRNITTACWNFNPRSHEESGFCLPRYAVRDRDFNPRSHEESGPPQCICAPEILYFNPRSHEESGCRRQTRQGRISDFNPRSHEESGAIVWYIV